MRLSIALNFSELSPQNASTLAAVESAQFVLCLDAPAVPKASYTDEEVHLNQLLHGGVENATNRWFDKCLQLVMATNGHAGVCYEHSPAEGPAVAALMDYTVDVL